MVPICGSKLLEFIDSKTMLIGYFDDPDDLLDCNPSLLDITVENNNVDALQWMLNFYELGLKSSQNASWHFNGFAVRAYNCAMRCANIDFMQRLDEKNDRMYDAEFECSQNPQVLLAHLELGHIPRNNLKLVVDVDFAETFRVFAAGSHRADKLIGEMFEARNVDFLSAYIQEDCTPSDSLVKFIDGCRDIFFNIDNFRMLLFSLTYMYTTHYKNNAYCMTKFLDKQGVNLCGGIVHDGLCLTTVDSRELRQIIDFPGVECSHYPTLFNAILRHPTYHASLFPCILRHSLNDTQAAKIVHQLQRELERAEPSSEFIDAFRTSTLSSENREMLFSNIGKHVDTAIFLFTTFQCTFDTYAAMRYHSNAAPNLSLGEQCALSFILQSSDYEIPERYFQFIVRDLTLAGRARDIDVLLARNVTDQPTKRAFICAAVAPLHAKIIGQIYDYEPNNKKRKI